MATANRIIQRGDRVKLTEHGARVNQKTYMIRAHRVDWASRRGTVVVVGKVYIYIRWDGRTSLDYQQPGLIEPAEE